MINQMVMTGYLSVFPTKIGKMGADNQYDAEKLETRNHNDDT